MEEGKKDKDKDNDKVKVKEANVAAHHSAQHGLAAEFLSLICPACLSSLQPAVWNRGVLIGTG
jgi:hypothetical protein